MKHFYLTALIASLVFSGYSQESEQPFKKCNTIKVQETTLIEFAKFLQAKGFTIDEINKELENMKTDGFEVKALVGTTGFIHANKIDGSLLITGYRVTSLGGAQTTSKMKKISTAWGDGVLFKYVNKLVIEYSEKNNLSLSYILL